MQPISTLSTPAEAAPPRPDTDIADEVVQVIRNYPPLHVSREHIHIEVHGGLVAINGNTRSVQGIRFLQNEVPRIAGVNQLNLNHLYDDEAVRLNVAEKLPDGLYVNVQYGVVSLNGTPAADLDQQSLFAAIKSIPGVRHVMAQFSAALKS